MKKIAVSLFVVLLLVNAGLVFFQYYGFSESGGEKAPVDFSYAQEIEVTYANATLEVRHTFTDLPSGELTLVWPKAATAIACEEGACNRLAGDSATFTAGDTNQQVLTYKVPIAGGLKSQTLMQNVFVQLQAGTADTSTVHISTKNGQKGQWITGLPLSSTNTLDGLTYTVFSGKGNVYDLYWQAGDIALKTATEDYSIYSAYNVTDKFVEEVSKMEIEFNQHVAIIQAKKQNVHENSRFIFMPELNLAQVKTQIVAAQLATKYKVPADSPAWLSQLLIAEVADITLTDPRAQQIRQELTKRLTTKQNELLHEKIVALKGETVTLEQLDEMLTSIIGKKTSFFTANATSKSLYPLLFEDERGIYINEVRIDALQAIQYNDLTYYLANPFLETIGYKGGEGANGFYVTGHGNSYRFPVSEFFYVFNERRYDVKTRPVDKIGGQYYIEEAWLVRLFKVDVRKKDRVIEITTIQGEQ